MLALSTAHPLTVSLFGDNGGTKRGRKVKALSLKDVRLNYLFKTPFSLLALRPGSIICKAVLTC